MDRPRLALIELLDREGRGGGAHAVDVHAWPLTLGRALDNDVVIDDPHVAARHLRLDGTDDGVTLSVLDSDNGVLLGRRRLARGASERLPAGGAELLVGTTRVRVRLPGETLAPELPLPRRPALPLASGALLALLLLAAHWLGLDPGDDATAWLPVVAGTPVAIAGWCGLWALLSKLFQHRFDFVGHLRIALPWLLGIELAGALLPLAGATLAWPALWHLAPALQVLLAALMVRQHLARVLPAYPRTVTAVVAAATVAGSAVSLALTHRATDSYARAPYMSTLPLPMLRLGGAAPPQDLVQRMAPLEQALAERAAKARAEDDEAQDDESE